jgi:hypothetical protein
MLMSRRLKIALLILGVMCVLCLWVASRFDVGNYSGFFILSMMLLPVNILKESLRLSMLILGGLCVYFLSMALYFDELAWSAAAGALLLSLALLSVALYSRGAEFRLPVAGPVDRSWGKRYFNGMGFRPTEPPPGPGFWEQYVSLSMFFVPALVYSRAYRFVGDEVLAALQTLRAVFQ